MGERRRRAVLVTGMPGAGKSVFVKACADMGAKVVAMGDAVREHAQRAGILQEKTGEFANQERLNRGARIWAQRTLEMMGGGLHVVDGLRSEEELRAFHEALGEDLVVVAIHASPKTRLARLAARGRGDDFKTPEDLMRRDSRELGWGLGSVIALADVMIVNEASIEELQERARAILRPLI